MVAPAKDSEVDLDFTDPFILLVVTCATAVTTAIPNTKAIKILLSIVFCFRDCWELQRKGIFYFRK